MSNQSRFTKSSSRRQFLRGAVGTTIAVAGFPQIVPSSVLGLNGATAPSNKITMGFIGTGNQGTNDMKGFLRDDRVHVMAVCDVNKRGPGYWNGKIAGRDPAREIVESYYGKNTPTGNYKGCDTHRDFRDVLERKDIDAVEIATPDHWHAIPTILAAKSGKDIYCQKPLALTVAEGRAMSQAVSRYKRVFQTGSQQRSDRRFRHGCELVRNGRIGKLLEVECGLPGGRPDFGKNGDRKSPEPVPAGFDYDFWLGPAPEAPYAPARVGVNFRWIYDHSGGQLTDWGGHHPDIAQWGMGTTYTGPVAIKNAKGVWDEDELWNTATQYSFEAHYRSGVVLKISDKFTMGVKFKGTDGWVYVNRGKIDASSKSLLDEEFSDNEIRLPVSDNHFRNFIDCVISRGEPVAPVEQAHRSISICHLGNIAMLLGRDLKWDPEREQVVGDHVAHSMLNRPYRAPWVLPS
ncbi:Gfo/Idh/MocA family oxidoreductase [bacterium]|jgi:predicted dehydrogenase|nr:Gfo/Idh/MocA family oxidoreductase [Verrucomicrobiota bacterium]MDA7633569.1 Gfo/Idh/MocA family oxidoreductase [bacterium]